MLLSTPPPRIEGASARADDKSPRTVLAKRLGLGRRGAVSPHFVALPDPMLEAAKLPPRRNGRKPDPQIGESERISG